MESKRVALEEENKNNLAELYKLAGGPEKLENISVDAVTGIVDRGARPNEGTGEMVFNITEEDKELATRKRLMPRGYLDAKFDSDTIKESVARQSKIYKMYKVTNYDKYIGACYSILTALRAKKLPNRSMLIGAPDGFCQADFANEAIMIMSKLNWRAVPYISLIELAELRAAESQRLMRPLNIGWTNKVYNEGLQDYITEAEEYQYINSVTPASIVKKPQLVQSAYSYSEYINADVLFVHFTSVENKDVESKQLLELLRIRGPKRLPTIAMIFTSIKPYMGDKELCRLAWDNILDCGAGDLYGKVAHVSCYFELRDKLSDRNDSNDEEID